jgi:hypothetical protein
LRRFCFPLGTTTAVESIAKFFPLSPAGGSDGFELDWVQWILSIGPLAKTRNRISLFVDIGQLELRALDWSASLLTVCRWLLQLFQWKIGFNSIGRLCLRSSCQIQSLSIFGLSDRL